MVRGEFVMACIGASISTISPAHHHYLLFLKGLFCWHGRCNAEGVNMAMT